ncbi:DUF72 domain-containing protein [Paenibacillus sp. ACRRX]|uniref:DUF72 domain-containing protein n=1 Tax=Paenibacillus sp. ACRRX TaxID=2918206 RepID=UPI001EF54DC0|nr:DUF72 domain-containing protein [Paenibacillus sp. ACRRX]MCG7407199.1 DUF72 domain-containing protein [Paenibacillus sp. ACRRX]
MIEIGLAGWGDHNDLYRSGVAARNKLKAYSSHFPVVEVDSSFYAIQAASTFEKWSKETPNEFGFIVKAYQGMTGHDRKGMAYEAEAEMFRKFIHSIEPIRQSGKLKSVLFQYPPWFDCTREHVHTLKKARHLMGNMPLSLEFRHQSWFTPDMRARTLTFMEQQHWAHSICDEPQAGQGSVPIVPHPTNPDVTLVRFHGRNVSGWKSHGQTNWRDVRYLYHYNKQELSEWRERLLTLQQHSKHIYVIFNNNSGGHAAQNAKDLIQLLGITYEGLGPRQLDLFE